VRGRAALRQEFRPAKHVSIAGIDYRQAFGPQKFGDIDGSRLVQEGDVSGVAPPTVAAGESRGRNEASGQRLQPCERPLEVVIIGGQPHIEELDDPSGREGKFAARGDRGDDILRPGPFAG
jgi:hypothetical protein